MPIPRDPTPVPIERRATSVSKYLVFSRQTGIAFFQLSPGLLHGLHLLTIDLAVGIVLIRKLDQSFHQVIETILELFLLVSRRSFRRRGHPGSGTSTTMRSPVGIPCGQLRMEAGASGN